MKYCKLEFYVPVNFVEEVKFAVFAAGAGKLGNYDNCCWQTSGSGQFRPLPGSAPFIGSQEKVEAVEEIKVELLCPEDKIRDAIAALKKAHPYETPAYQYYPVSVD
jgi:hypothetical protein